MTNLKVPYDPRLNKPFMTPILEIKVESSKVKSFTVEYNPINEKIHMYPGQFVMVWIPGIDEIPMSISKIGLDNTIRISVAAVGEATEALHKLKLGDKIGIRGPYGTWYKPQPGTAIIIGGGIGMASIMPLIHYYCSLKKEMRSSFTIIEGAKTKSELLFEDEINNLIHDSSVLQVCTDDGTCGFKGFTTEKLDELLKIELNLLKARKEDHAITVYACGPEKMLKKVLDLCDKYAIPTQLSLERMMRCGFGICGLCALEPTGMLVCRDGPIFTSEELAHVTDFGKIHRDFSGKPHSI